MDVCVHHVFAVCDVLELNDPDVSDISDYWNKKSLSST